ELVVGAIIPADRLTRRYHLQWHLAHGHFSAQMRNEELLALEGGLRPEPLTGTFLFGVPSHVFAELPRALRRGGRPRRARARARGGAAISPARSRSGITRCTWPPTSAARLRCTGRPGDR